MNKNTLTIAIITSLAVAGSLLWLFRHNITDTAKKALGMSYFTIDELCASTVAKQKGIDNTPTSIIRSRLNTLITECLDKVREIYGAPIIVSSGYRCPILNKAVGGVDNSAHLTGYAADLIPAKGGSLRGIFEACIRFGNFDQLIIEEKGLSKWVHISYSGNSKKRREILAYKNGIYTDISHNWQNFII